MASRYRNNAKKVLSTGRTVLKSRIYPNIALRDDDLYVASETGDRLDTLAYQYYQDSNLWWIIASANNVHDGKLGLADGTVLRIPQNYIEILSNFNQ